MAEAAPLAEIKLEDKDLRRMVRKVLPQKAESGVKRTALLIEAAAVQNAPEDTGNLVNSGTTIFSGRGFDTRAEIKFTARYALFVHEGTGIFGPKGKPIRPIRAKALKITLRDGTVIFRKSSKGMKGRPFLKDAFEQEGPKLLPSILE